MVLYFIFIALLKNFSCHDKCRRAVLIVHFDNATLNIIVYQRIKQKADWETRKKNMVAGTSFLLWIVWLMAMVECEKI